MSRELKTDVIILGAGPAGYTAAMLGVDEANCRMLTEAAPVCVLCGQIHMFLALRAILATRAARMNPPL